MELEQKENKILVKEVLLVMKKHWIPVLID